ncbi:MAG: ATP synthase F1 subunit gamma [Acidobacteriota bacterium]|nr:ATP synthase F1 subunit gamma [Acidobacteriota bacterium]
MPSLLDVRRRVRAVKSTEQITKAMKMVAASKLRRAQDQILGARPFAHHMLRVLNDMATRVEPSAHPLLREHAVTAGRTLTFVITADKGLCGSFNTNIIKTAERFSVEDPDREVALGLVGRKGRDFFNRRGFDVRYELVNLFAKLSSKDSQAIAETAIDDYMNEKVDTVYLVYNEFKSVLQQRVVVERLLPIGRLVPDDMTAKPVAPMDHDAAKTELLIDYLYEPAAQEIFSKLIPHHVEIQIYRALLESAAAEHAARMTAMDAATKNSGELIEQLTIYMNKVRQAAITREIIEVVSGAEAL